MTYNDTNNHIITQISPKP